MNLETLIAKFKQSKDGVADNQINAELTDEDEGRVLMRELAIEMGKPPDYQFSDEELCEIADLPVTKQPLELSYPESAVIGMK